MPDTAFPTSVSGFREEMVWLWRGGVNKGRRRERREKGKKEK